MRSWRRFRIHERVDAEKDRDDDRGRGVYGFADDGECRTGSSVRSFTNPLLRSGPDPWIVRHRDTYYYMHTLGNRLAIRATKDVSRLADAPETVVWTPPATGPNAQSIWAPELHRIDGKWYLYYTAAARA